MISANQPPPAQTEKNAEPAKGDRPKPHSDHTSLIFAPLAWLKLQFFLHAGDTEISGFGISDEDDPLYIQEFHTVCQSASGASFEMDDEAVADYFDRCVNRGLAPGRFARAWLHTHPGDSPRPSSTDESTFERVFGRCDWSVLFVISRSSAIYARLAFSAGPGGTIMLPVAVDWAAWPRVVADGVSLAQETGTWEAEYQANIQPTFASLSHELGWSANRIDEEMARWAQSLRAAGYSEDELEVLA